MQPAAHVQLVRLHVLGLMIRSRLELDLQRRRHALCDGVLHLENVRELLFEFSGPQLPAVRDAQQSRRRAQRPSAICSVPSTTASTSSCRPASTGS